MVEVTTTAVIDRIKSYLGLRGKAVVTSRNSLYPVVVVNSDAQQIPILPPRLSGSYTVVKNCFSLAGAGPSTVYTVPDGKKLLLLYACQVQLNAAATNTQVQNSGSTLIQYLFAQPSEATGNTWAATVWSTPLEFVAGDKFILTGAAGGQAYLSLFGWLEDA